jgi:type IV pilus assembly protein PilM
MASSSVCWGIEIGAAAIKAIKLEATGEDRVKVLDYAVIQHPKVLSTPGVDANDVLRVSLGALTSQYDLHKASIAVSVPGHSAFARFAKLPPVEPKKVPDIVKFEAMQQIPFSLDDVEWDYQTFVSPDSPDVEVGIFAITREKVTERLNMLADVGITPNYVVLSPIAVYNALAYDLEFDAKTPGTIIVDVGTTSTDLVIATPGRMWVRTFPIGGHQFTEALVNQFQLSYPKAEKLKREAEDTKHARQVFQAMRPVFTDLAQDIQRSIGYYQSLNKDAQLTRLIGVGSTFQLPGLRKYLKQQLSMDVYRIENFKRLKMEGERAAQFEEASLNLATAYGLGLQGLELNAVGGNLMPVNVLRKSMWKEKVAWFGLAAGIAGLASAVMFIRPVKDYFDVTGRVVDPVVQSSQSHANELKKEATEAGVTSGGEPDLRAANMVALLDKREVYDMIAGDLGQVFAAGDAALPTWAASLAPKGGGEAPAAVPGPAFNLDKFSTDYLAPRPESADPSMSLGGGAAPARLAAEDRADEPSKIMTFPRIRCDLDMSTAQPEPRRLVEKTVGKWLAANQKRAGIPYTIVYSEPAFRVTEVGRDSSASRLAGTGDAGPQGSAAPGPAARPGSGRGVKGARPEYERGPQGEQPPPKLYYWGGNVGGTPDKTSQEAQAAQSALDKVAPLEEPVEGQPPKTATVRVTWWVVFMPEPPAEGGASGGNK